MPTYDYECTSCGHSFEASQKMSDAPLAKCPKCGKKIKRLIGGGGGIIFKGAGFYANDYKKPSKPDVSGNACPKAGGHSGCQGCPGHG